MNCEGNHDENTNTKIKIKIDEPRNVWSMRHLPSSILDHTIYSAKKSKEIATSASAIVYTVRPSHDPTMSIAVKVFFMNQYGRNENGILKRVQGVEHGVVSVISKWKYFECEIDPERLEGNAKQQYKNLKQGINTIGVMIMPCYEGNMSCDDFVQRVDTIPLCALPSSTPTTNSVNLLPGNNSTIMRFVTDFIQFIQKFHQRGFAHLDIRTENFLFGDGRMFMIDFDSSIPMDPSTGMTKLKISPFEKNKTPPELLKFKTGDEVDVRALDMWFTGLLFIYILCGTKEVNYQPTHIPNLSEREICIVHKEGDRVLHKCNSETEFRAFLMEMSSVTTTSLTMTNEERVYIVDVIVNLMYVNPIHRSFVPFMKN